MPVRPAALHATPSMIEQVLLAALFLALVAVASLPGARAASAGFLGPRDPVKVVSEDYGIDLEAEIVVITDDVPMAVRGCCVAQRLTGRQVKPRGAAWRPSGRHPEGPPRGRAAASLLRCVSAYAPSRVLAARARRVRHGP